jgi:hypothetical protein
MIVYVPIQTDKDGSSKTHNDESNRAAHATDKIPVFVPLWKRANHIWGMFWQGI